MPAATIASASGTVATEIPRAPAANWRRAISGHLCVLACGRNVQPLSESARPASEDWLEAGQGPRATPGSAGRPSFGSPTQPVEGPIRCQQDRKRRPGRRPPVQSCPRPGTGPSPGRHHRASRLCFHRALPPKGHENPCPIDVSLESTRRQRILAGPGPAKKESQPDTHTHP